MKKLIKLMIDSLEKGMTKKKKKPLIENNASDQMDASEKSSVND